MNINIHGHNFKVTERTAEYATEKLEKLSRYLPNIRDIHLELSLEESKRGGDFSVAEITLVHARGAILRAEERANGKTQASIDAAINQAIDKMYRQITRFRGKRRDKRRQRGRFAPTEEELALAEELPEEVSTVEEDDPYADFLNGEEPDVVRRKTVSTVPMTEHEAIDQMELLGHKFFMFLNAETNVINVVYRRDDGDYGVLIPMV